MLHLYEVSGQTKVFLRPSVQDLKKDTTNRKFSLHREENQIIDARVNPPKQYLNENVIVYHANTFMYCDTAIIQGSILKMRQNVVLVQSDSIRIFADSMVYNADSLVAYLFGDIILENGNKNLFTSKLRYDVKNKIASYQENALLEQDSTQVVSKTGIYFVDDKYAVFKTNVKVTGSDFVLFADSLGFETENQVSRFLSPTRIQRDTVDIYSESGWFDIDDKKGDFIQNAQYLAGKSLAVADTIHYDGVKDMIVLSSLNKNSRYESETDTALARKIWYDRKNEIYILKDSVSYKGKDNDVTGSYVEYNKGTGKFKTIGRGTVSDSPMIITADSLDYDKILKTGTADGQVIWADTAANTTIYADHVRYRGNDNYMLAYNETGTRPYFTTKVDTSLMHMKADTLKSIRVITSIDSLQNDTIDYFTGFNDVRVFKENLQMVCDSITYNKRDSIFTLFNTPLVWSDTTQITGDTMKFFMKNKSIDKLVILENGTIINSEDLRYFDQVQGKYIETHFEEGKMKNMKVDGDAQVIYYLKDDNKAFIGVNQSKSSYITFRMENNKISDIYFYIDVKSKVLPMATDHDSLKIKGFQWQDQKRPKSVDDL